MSPGNVESALRRYEAFNRRDFDSAFEGWHPDAEWDTTDAYLDGKVYRGIPAVRAYWEDTVRRWGGDVAFEVEEVVDQGDTVVCVTRIRGKGAQSEVPIDSQWVHVWCYRDGVVVRCRNFRDRGAALEAVAPGK